MKQKPPQSKSHKRKMLVRITVIFVLFLLLTINVYSWIFYRKAREVSKRGRDIALDRLGRRGPLIPLF